VSEHMLARKESQLKKKSIAGNKFEVETNAKSESSLWNLWWRILKQRFCQAAQDEWPTYMIMWWEGDVWLINKAEEQNRIYACLKSLVSLCS
jgi:hypothetical protein